MALQVVSVILWVLIVIAAAAVVRSRKSLSWSGVLRRSLNIVLASVGVIALIVSSALVYFGVGLLESSRQTSDNQAALDPFYAQFQGSTGAPGELLAKEVISDVAVPGATAWRILYRSTGPKGEPTISSGMVFVPDETVAHQVIVAWAHPTSGLGDSCAPSRAANHLRDTANWLDQMMSNGWVVTATDYSGLGTPGVSYYLDGISESADVAYSVVAAQRIRGVTATEKWALWGHSQGGHSALWTAERAGQLLPNMKLVGVAAAAPAAELNSIMEAQWRTVVGWVIGPEVSQGLPRIYPDMTMNGIVSSAGQKSGEQFAMECIDTSAVLGMGRQNLLNQTYFESNPASNQGWYSAMQAQTPQPLQGVPVLVVQSLSDQVVLAWPNARLQQTWCDAGSELDMMWVGDVSHQQTATNAGPSVVAWLDQRFAGEPIQRTCTIPAPIQVPLQFQ